MNLQQDNFGLASALLKQTKIVEICAVFLGDISKWKDDDCKRAILTTRKQLIAAADDARIILEVPRTEEKTSILASIP